MKPLSPLAAMLLTLSFCACKDSTRQDTVIASAANPSHTYRATVIQRQYYVDGKYDTSPTTYVLLDRDSGKPNYDNGAEFKDSQIIMQPSQCGPLSLQWTSDNALRITCERCGLALSALGPHAHAMGEIRIDYDSFPEMSSWETGPHGN